MPKKAGKKKGNKFDFLDADDTEDLKLADVSTLTQHLRFSTVK